MTRRRFLAAVPGVFVLGRTAVSMQLFASTSQVAVIEREAWGAMPPIGSYQPHRVERLTVHHTGAYLSSTARAPAAIRSAQRYHQVDLGWSDLAYHFMIDPAGNVYEGRPPDVRGDTATTYDPTGHLLACLVGDYDTQTPTAAQLESLALVLAWGAGVYGLDPTVIGGHRDYAATTCPGDRVYAALPGVRSRVATLLATGGTDLRYLRGPEAFGLVMAIEGTPLPAGTALGRWSGHDRYATAAAVSADAFPTGATTVYLATGDNFPDALGAGPAAAHTGAPILLTTHDTIPTPTADELTRLAPQKIIVVGASGAISSDVENALAAYAPTITRLAGPDRYATAAAVSADAFPTGATTVYLATGDNFPDALGAGPAAAHTGAPILLTTHDTIPTPTADELTRLAPQKILLAGGIGVISYAVERALVSFLRS